MTRKTLLTIVAIAIPAIPVLFLVGDRVSGWLSGDLKAEVLFGDYRIPPRVQEFVNMFRGFDRPASADSAVREYLDSEHISQQERIVALEAINEYRSALRSQLPYELERIQGYWLVNITNQNRRKVTGVRLVLPDISLAAVSRGGITKETDPLGGVLTLGDLATKEKAQVFAWTTWPVHSYKVKDIELTHDEGVGAIRARVPVGRVGRWADSLVSPFGFILLLMAVAWVLLLINQGGSGARPSPAAASQAQPSPTAGEASAADKETPANETQSETP